MVRNVGQLRWKVLFTDFHSARHVAHGSSNAIDGIARYAIDFIDPKHFVYAGGGGAGRTGVPNVIVCRAMKSMD